MSTTTRATTSYKKKDGALSIQPDKKFVHWTPSGSDAPTVTIPVANITNLQQTPAGSKSVALKIVVGDDSYVFTFTHKENARREQEMVTDTLRDAIPANKAKDTAIPLASATPAASAGTEGQSAAMAMAKAVSSKAADEGWYDDNKLKSDLQLQRSLLEANKPLKERFEQALKDRPESVSISQFTGQFWSQRLHLLRAYAIENAQKQGDYNVLPEIRFVRKPPPPDKPDEEPTLLLNINKEQISLIFRQYPVVKHAYDQLVPRKTNPDDFWTRFFRSRLLKTLKGEKVMQHDPIDKELDEYVASAHSDRESLNMRIPNWMDLEGNEQNHSQRKGNRPDEDMRPSGHDKAPILRILNSLSEKMLDHVAPEDDEAHAPIGMDEGTFEQLQLRDLAMEDIDNRVVLNIREQQRYAGGSQDDLSAEAKLYAQQDPGMVLSLLQAQLQPLQPIGYHTDSDSDDDDETPKQALRVGSHDAMSSATSAVLASVKQRRLAASSDPKSLNGLSQSVFDQLTMTHNTTTEFLHYFWSLFLAGDASRTNELAQLVSTLDRSMDRINAVGAQAEAERQKYIDSVKEADRKYYEQTNKRRRRDFSQAKGGKAVVDAMINPTVKALAQATSAYKKAFEEQTKANAALAAS